MNNQGEYIQIVDFFTGELICWIPKDIFENWSTRKEINLIWFLKNLTYNNPGTCLEVKNG